MTDCVDTVVDRVQPTSSQPAFNRPSADAKQLELTSPDDAVLLFREPGYPPVDGFTPYTDGAFIRPPFSVAETVNGGRFRHAAKAGKTGLAYGALSRMKAQRKGGSSPPVPPLALIP